MNPFCSVELGQGEMTYLVVVKKDLVARLLGAAAAPLPKARYVKLVFALCSPVSCVDAGGESLVAMMSSVLQYGAN